MMSSVAVVMSNVRGMSYITKESQNGSWKSCSHFLQAQGPNAEGFHEVMIDLDGLGPLAPVSVVCEVTSDGDFVTSIRHSNEEVTKVDGFQDRGSFHQVIHYHATADQINTLVNSSTKCWQSLTYACRQSRLFGSETGNFQPFGWWVSWKGEKMDFWSGSSPGSRQCACGTRGSCFDPERACNCDSGHEDWLEDSGEISSKEHLPVGSLRFGDTGTPMYTKEGRFSLGQLKCVRQVEGDEDITLAVDDSDSDKRTLYAYAKQERQI